MLVLAVFVVIGSAARSFAVDTSLWVPALVFPFSVGMTVLFLWWSPRFLLAKRLSWNTTLPAGVSTSVGIMLTTIWSVVWLPKIIIDQAERYGAIGITFGIFTWLYAISLALVAGAVLAGAVEDVRQKRTPALAASPSS